MQREWFLDDLLEKAEHQKKKDLKRLSNKVKKETRALINKAQRDTRELFKTRDILGAVSTTIDISHFAEAQHLIESRLSLLEDAKPFLIGPATTDSVLNMTPKNYDYIDEGKVPFDNMFFEFLEGEKYNLPFLGTSVAFKGLHLCRDDDGDFPYLGQFYLQDGKTYTISALFGNEMRDVFRGDIGRTSKISEYSYVVDIRNREIYYEKYPITLQRMKEGKYRRSDVLNSRHLEQVYGTKKSLDNLKDSAFFDVMPNLCVNIVNFANAKNVTVVERERRRKNKRRNGERKIYHILKSPDRVSYKYNGKSDNKLWELNMRIAVQSYDRTYKFEDGSIKETQWIKSHIKGPEDAPYKNKVHRIMCEKIEREKSLN